MEEFLYKYNPFTLYGRYNINQYLYQNKKRVTIILFVVSLILILGIVTIYTSQQKTNSIPPQVQSSYGYGPFGWGEYLPTKELLLESILY